MGEIMYHLWVTSNTHKYVGCEIQEGRHIYEDLNTDDRVN
jgi:hypothetical protein